jgi:hypothetical protein
VPEQRNTELQLSVTKLTLAEEALQKAHDDLERRVEEPTAELMELTMAPLPACPHRDTVI